MPKSYGQVKGRKHPCNQPEVAYKPEPYDQQPNSQSAPKSGPKRVRVDDKRVFDTLKAASIATGVTEYQIRRSIRERKVRCGHKFELVSE